MCYVLLLFALWPPAILVLLVVWLIIVCLLFVCAVVMLVVIGRLSFSCYTCVIGYLAYYCLFIVVCCCLFVVSTACNQGEIAAEISSAIMPLLLSIP